MRIRSLITTRAWLASPVVLVLLAAPVLGQTAVPQPGFGTLDVNYQWAHAKYHLFSAVRPKSGTTKVDMGPMDSQTMFIGGDYCPVRGLDVTASAAFVAARYMGTLPEHPTDTSTFQSSPQDATIGLDYVAGFEGITFAGNANYRFPMTNYLTMGHNALGRGLDQVGVGLLVSRALPRLPGTVAAVGFGHDFQEDVSIWTLGTDHFTAELGYFVTSQLSVGTHFSYSQTHNGFDWTNPADWATPGGSVLHDQAAAALVRTVGGTVNWQFNSSYSVGVDVGGVISGANTTDPMTYSLLTSYNFWSPFARHKAGF